MKIELLKAETILSPPRYLAETNETTAIKFLSIGEFRVICDSKQELLTLIDFLQRINPADLVSYIGPSKPLPEVLQTPIEVQEKDYGAIDSLEP